MDGTIARAASAGLTRRGNLGALLSLDHANVILTLQVQLELRAVAEIPAKPHRGIGRDRAAAIEDVGDTGRTARRYRATDGLH
jgi:hypothetical protein